jgi:hypothetical protein
MTYPHYSPHVWHPRARALPWVRACVFALACLAVSTQTLADPITDLSTWLQLNRQTRPDLASQPSAQTALTRTQSEEARTLIWAERNAFVKAEWGAQWTAKRLTMGDLQMRFDYRVRGTKPAAGYDLYISMHGGGEAAASVNDQQWQNQIALYQPPGIYLAPRAPTDAWNMWHRDHIDAFFDRLIHLAVAMQEANPNRVYILGYSAGGDGAYQLTPRMADRWAAGAMMAGHPNNASPINLRNIGMTLHMGGLDAAYSRNTLVVDFGRQIQKLQDANSGFYKYQVKVYPDKPHWMDLLDAEALPWMAAFTRQPHPKKLAWQQDTTVGSPIALTDPKVKDPPTQWRFHWLGRPDRKIAPRQAKLTAEIRGQEVRIDSANLDSVEVWLNDSLVDLDKPVAVYWKGTKVFEGLLTRTAAMLYRSLDLRGDREMVYPVRMVVSGTGIGLVGLRDSRDKQQQRALRQQRTLGQPQNSGRHLRCGSAGNLVGLVELGAGQWHNVRGEQRR